jgi:hypothetical protein
VNDDEAGCGSGGCDGDQCGQPCHHQYYSSQLRVEMEELKQVNTTESHIPNTVSNYQPSSTRIFMEIDMFINTILNTCMEAHTYITFS